MSLAGYSEVFQRNVDASGVVPQVWLRVWWRGGVVVWQSVDAWVWTDEGSGDQAGTERVASAGARCRHAHPCTRRLLRPGASC